MGLVYEYLTYDGKSSEDFKIHISGSGTFVSPSRDVESISIPGRNGDLHIDNGRYNNVPISYPAFCVDNFEENYGAFKDFLLSRRGYKRLEDSYHPDKFRRAAYKESLNPSMTPLNRAGEFEIIFDCDPRFFLKKGEEPITIQSGTILKNPTYQIARPIIRVYGTGTINVNDVTIVVTSSDGYTDLDSEMEEAYMGAVNCNANIQTENNRFPILNEVNEITYTGFSEVIITPNWWSV